MQAPVPLASSPELDAAILQAAITAALAGLCAFLYSRYRKPYFGWWALAWGLYLLRIGAIISFIATSRWIWLYWHQVITGWVALALLWAALVFSQQLRWRWRYMALVLFPPLWSYVAIYQLDHFLLAAGPAVLFLSLATLWTGWVFYRYQQRVKATGAKLLAAALFLWGLHHLDYPFLRARGAWAPWGYYLDILFELAVGAGIVLLVLDDLGRGLRALSAVSGDLQQRAGAGSVLDSVLGRLLTLPAVRGSALYLSDAERLVRGAGVCAAWSGGTPPGDVAGSLARALATGKPQGTSHESNGETSGSAPYAFVAVLPVFQDDAVTGALILVGDARDPFTALDERFLIALGQQVGVALENADLYQRLQARTVELGQLSARVVEQHEEERRRLSRELHDETAQVFSAVKMELGVLREDVASDQARRLDRALGLIDTGIRSIRSVTNDLRPSLLDDLGLLPALRSLVADFGERSGIEVELDAATVLPPLSKEAELGLFRALQEGLSNVVRHAEARRVGIGIGVREGMVALEVRDDGRGVSADGDFGRLERAGHMGLAGMRERISALGGTVRLEGRPGAGARLRVEVPARPPEPSANGGPV